MGGRLVASEATSHSWSLVDETGTTNASFNSEEIQQQERIDIRRVSDEILQVHGVLPGRKDDGIVRLLYENANGIPNRLGGMRSWIRQRNLLTNLAQTSLHIMNTDRTYATRIIEMDGTSSSGGGNRMYAQLSHITYMKQIRLGECRREVRDYSCSDQSQST